MSGRQYTVRPFSLVFRFPDQYLDFSRVIMFLGGVEVRDFDLSSSPSCEKLQPKLRTEYLRFVSDTSHALNQVWPNLSAEGSNTRQVSRPSYLHAADWRSYTRTAFNSRTTRRPVMCPYAGVLWPNQNMLKLSKPRHRVDIYCRWPLPR